MNDSKPMVERDRSANSAPNLGSVLTWCCTGDVNACSAFALHDVVHETPKRVGFMK